MQRSFPSALRSMPLARIIFPFILGIYFATKFHLFYNVAFALLFCSLIVLIVFHFIAKNTARFQLVIAIYVYLIIMLWGYCVSCFQIHRYESLNNSVKYHFVGQITEVPVVHSKTVKTVVTISQIYSDSVWVSKHSKIVASFAIDSNAINLHVGDCIVAKAYSNPILNFKTNGHFYYRSYLEGKQIYNRMYIPSYWWKMVKPADWNINTYSINIRNKIDSIYRLCLFPREDQTVLSALMLGVRTEMSPDLLSAYSKTGAMHILAVSGLHVGILYLVLSWILFFMKGKMLEILKAIIIVCCIWFYAFMTGFCPSIERAAIMFSLFTLARQWNNSTNVYNTLAGTALLSLLINPLDIFDIGFQLSYLAIIGIVYFSKKIDLLYLPNNKGAKKLWDLLTVSLSAQFLTLPLTMYYFGQFPTYFLLTNFIAIPLSFVVMILGILIIPCFYLSHHIFSFVAYFLGKSVWLQNMTITKIAALPYSSLHCTIPLWGSMLLFCIIAGIMIGIERKRFN